MKEPGSLEGRGDRRPLRPVWVATQGVDLEFKKPVWVATQGLQFGCQPKIFSLGGNPRSSVWAAAQGLELSVWADAHDLAFDVKAKFEIKES